MSAKMEKLLSVRKSLPVRAIRAMLKLGVIGSMRMGALVIGFMLMMMGVFFSMTIIGAIMGVPCIIAGAMIFAKGLY